MSDTVTRIEKVEKLEIPQHGREKVQLVVHSYRGDLEAAIEESAYSRGGTWMGEVAVKLNIDDQFSQVLVASGESADVSVLERAIEAIQATIEALRPYREHARGRCMASGDWGRRRADEGHPDGRDGAHYFPTREQFEAELREARS